jgi:hypothetical protein
MAGGQVDIEVVQALDGWPARRWEFADVDTRHGAGEDLGKDGDDRRDPSISNGNEVMAGWQAGSHMGMAGVGVELGRPRRKRPTMIFSNSNPFSHWINLQERIKIGEILGDLRKIWNLAWR